MAIIFGIGFPQKKSKNLSLSEKEIALSHGKNCGRLAGQQDAIGAYFVGFRDRLPFWAGRRCGSCLFSRGRGIFSRPTKCFLSPSFAGTPAFERGFGNERQRCGLHRAAVAAEHGAVDHRLRRGDGGVGVAHYRPGDEAALDDHLRLDAEKGGLPQHQVGELSRLRPSRFRATCRGRWRD